LVLRVLMVDSSYKARRDIDNKVDWVENDFELVGEANNGEEGLSLLPHVSPMLYLPKSGCLKWMALPSSKLQRSDGLI
jgi:DNA-binding NarL/FixJ family response regulator